MENTNVLIVIHHVKHVLMPKPVTPVTKQETKTKKLVCVFVNPLDMKLKELSIVQNVINLVLLVLDHLIPLLL